jgi:hypothetical protein
LSDACPQGYRVLAGQRTGAGVVQPLTEVWVRLIGKLPFNVIHGRVAGCRHIADRAGWHANARSGRSAEVRAEFTTDRLLSYTGRQVTYFPTTPPMAVPDRLLSTGDRGDPYFHCLPGQVRAFTLKNFIGDFR